MNENETLKAKDLFLKKYGNKITPAESWIIRFAEEYAEIKSQQHIKNIEETEKVTMFLFSLISVKPTDNDKKWALEWLEKRRQ